MALDTLRCNHLAPLGFKGLKVKARTEHTDNKTDRQTRPNVLPARPEHWIPNHKLKSVKCTVWS